MKKLNAIVVEDNEEYREKLVSMIRSFPDQIDVLGQAATYADASSKILEHHESLDLLFLDIELGDGKTSLDLIEELKGKILRFSCLIIFVTDYRDTYKNQLREMVGPFGLDGSMIPVDFYIWPKSITRDMISQVIRRRKATTAVPYSPIDFLDGLPKAAPELPKPSTTEAISYKDEDNVPVNVPFSSILVVQGEGEGYTNLTFYQKDNPRSFKKENKLPFSPPRKKLDQSSLFLEIRYGTWINKDCVIKSRKDRARNWFLTMQNGDEYPVTGRKAREDHELNRLLRAKIDR